MCIAETRTARGAPKQRAARHEHAPAPAFAVVAPAKRFDATFSAGPLAVAFHRDSPSPTRFWRARASRPRARASAAAARCRFSVTPPAFA